MVLSITENLFVMRIAGHRGAAGLAPENTLASIKAALDAGVDAVEFDVRQTKDGDFVLSHDGTTTRTTGTSHKIGETATKTLMTLVLENGERIPRLEQAIKLIGKKIPIIIDVKGGGWARQMARFVEEYQAYQITIISFNHNELARFHKQAPHVDVYALDHNNPFEVIYTAKKHNFTGIDLNFWIINPLTYFMARRAGMKIIVYTVNRVWMARFLQFLYPTIVITTDVPHKMQPLRRKKK